MSARTEPFWLSAFLDIAAADHQRTLTFWAAVTGSTVSPARGDDGEFATLEPPDGDAHLKAQRLADAASRVHLDLHVVGPHAAAARAVDLGATVVVDHADLGYAVLRSPAGLTLCLVSHPAARRSSPLAWPGGRSQVDQVCLDVGPAAYDAEWGFWRELTGFEPTPTDPPDGEFRRLDGAGPLRLLLQRLDEDREPGYHLDLSADDRGAEVARHVGLGATVLAEHGQWTVLADPAGTAYCITDRTPVPADG
ncbi:MAG: hypothetical protein JWN84_2226 [Nocardioides sp.]|nr:hypothetical protein [Nocardioides sp.]